MLRSLIIVLLLAIGSTGYVMADTLTVLHSFAGGADGWYPENGLMRDRAGNLYGTTPYGGINNLGVAYQLTPDENGTTWTETILYAFCSQADCADGEQPTSRLTIDTHGNLYGTTVAGGANRIGGVVFQLTPNASGTEWTETVLYSFCSQNDCTDGQAPKTRLTIDGAGNLYGTTSAGGANGWGVVFQLTPNASRTEWTETVLYSFCSQANCADGGSPNGGLLMDSAGNFYGTTSVGGEYFRRHGNGPGVIYQLAPKQSNTSWTQTVLHSFCAQRSGARCLDGWAPNPGLAMDDLGVIYGTAFFGGTMSGPTRRTRGGVVFALTPNPDATWTETVLYSFCSSTTDCPEGRHPYSGVIIDRSGNLYGTTYKGGAYGYGEVFKLQPWQVEHEPNNLGSGSKTQRSPDGRVDTGTANGWNRR